MPSLFPTVAALALGLLCLNAPAQEFSRSQLPPNHALIGTWRIELPKLQCFEEYELRADGIKLSRSAAERNESEFMLSLVPSAKGFYKWTERITSSNGQPDCAGAVTPIDRVAVSYVRLHPSGERFLLCDAEDATTCFAEFTRKR